MKGVFGFIGTTDATAYKRLLLDLDDEGTNYGNLGLRSRTHDLAALEGYVDQPATIPRTHGVDLSKWEHSYAPDHGRKALMEDIIALCKSGKHSGGIGPF